MSQDVFVRELAGKASQIEHFSTKSIEDPNLDSDSTADEIWRLIENLRIVQTNSRLVTCTKTLHHILPNLVPPMDREYTGTFFGWNAHDIQVKQRQSFIGAFKAFAEVAQSTQPQQYVGPGWSSSSTKILDNAIVGFCLVHQLNPSALVKRGRKLIEALKQSGLSKADIAGMTADELVETLKRLHIEHDF